MILAETLLSKVRQIPARLIFSELWQHLQIVMYPFLADTGGKHKGLQGQILQQN